MIGRLKGILLTKQAPQLLLDVQGVGYEISAPMTTFYKLPEISKEVTLHTHLVIREDAQLIYGFYTLRERVLFRTLIKVNGIGPKLALSILSGIEPELFIRCVMEADVTTLTKIPGVGKKTAERLIVEVKDKLAAMDRSELQESSDAGVISLQAGSTVIQDAISALQSLGYKAADASKAVAAVQVDGLSSEEIIRQALQQVSS